jgi:hypothetical protein
MLDELKRRAAEIDFGAAAEAGIREHAARIARRSWEDVLRGPLEQVLREVERQWRRRGWRGRFVLEDADGGRPPTMLAWYHLEYKRWWFWPPKYLGMLLVGPSPTSGRVSIVGSVGLDYSSLEELPAAIARFLASPEVGERLARVFGSPRDRGAG